MLKEVVGSSALLLARSFITRSIGALSTMVLARLLLPEEFGLVALATLVIGLLIVFTRTGSLQYIVRAKETDDALINSAWTLNLILWATSGLGLIVIAPLISSWYSEPDLTPVLQACAFLLLLQSVENPGVWILQREQKYGSFVTLDVVSKIISASVAVTLALLGASYWSLVAGRLTLTLVKVVGSYQIHPFRPRLSFERIREQFQFSLWLLLQSVFGYARVNLDTFLVSSNFGNAQLGSFATMKYLTWLPIDSIVGPATQPLLRQLSQNRDNTDIFRLQHNVAFLVTACIAIPISALMAATAPQLIQVFLGPNWVQFSDLFVWLSILIPAFLMYSNASRTCIVFGKSRVVFNYELFAAAIIFTPILIIGIEDVVAFTARRVQLEILASTLFFIYTAVKFTGIRNLVTLSVSALPIALSCGIAVVISESLPILKHAFLYLIAYGIVWGLAFLGSLFVLVFGFWKHQSEWAFLIEKSSGLLNLLKKKALKKLPQDTHS